MDVQTDLNFCCMHMPTCTLCWIPCQFWVYTVCLCPIKQVTGSLDLDNVCNWSEEDKFAPKMSECVIFFLINTFHSDGLTHTY